MNVPTSKRNLNSGKTEVPSKKKARKEKACTSTGDSEDAPVVGNKFSTSIRGVPELLKVVVGGTQELESTSDVEQSMQVEPEPSPANECTGEERFQKLQIITPSRRKEHFPQRLQRSPPMELLAPLNLCPFGETGKPVRRDRGPVSDELPVGCNVGSIGQTRVAGIQTVSTDSVSTTPTIHKELKDLHSTLQLKEAVILEDGRVSEPHGIQNCEKCHKIFLSVGDLERHFRVYHIPRTCYPCPLCKVFYATKRFVYRHLTEVHHISEEHLIRLKPTVWSQATVRELYQATRPTSKALALMDIAKLEAKAEEKCGKSSSATAFTTHSTKNELKDLHSTLQLKEAVILEDERVSEPDGIQSCEKCYEILPSVGALEKHCRVYHIPRTCYPCPVCKVFYASQPLVYRHLTKVHRISKEHLILLKQTILSQATVRELYQATRPTSNVLAPMDMAKLEAKAEEKCGISRSATAAFTTHSTKNKLKDLHSTLQMKGAVIHEDGGVSEPHGIQTCKKCYKIFLSVGALEKHCRVYHIPRICYPCPVCEVFYATKRFVYRHLTEVHQVSEEHLILLKQTILSQATVRELYQATRPTSNVLAPMDMAKLETKAEEKCGISRSATAAFTTHSTKNKLKDLHSTLQIKGAVTFEDGRVSEPYGVQSCEKCSEIFLSVGDLEKHCRVYHIPRTCYPCPVCKVFYATHHLVYRHLTKVHQVSEEHLILLKQTILSQATVRELYQATRPTSKALALMNIAKLEAKAEEKCGKSCSATAAFTTNSTNNKIRRDCCKPSSTIAMHCFCPEPCAIHQSLSSRLDAIVEKVQGMPPTNEGEEQSTSSSKNEDLLEDITSVSSDVNSVE